MAKKFPLSYVQHFLSRYGMKTDECTLTGQRLTVFTPYPSARKRKQFTHNMLFRFPGSEVSWMQGGVIIDLTKLRYKPAKGSWLEERRRRSDARAEQLEAQRNERNRSDNTRSIYRRDPDVLSGTVLGGARCDAGEMRRPEGEGSGDNNQPGGEEQRVL